MQRWLPGAACVLFLGYLLGLWLGRLPYPFDLEWMEGGMLAHAWRMERGLPVYVPPNADFVPYIYPPGYSAVVAALGSVVGLSPPVGRLVSVIGSLAAAAAAAFVVRRHHPRDRLVPVFTAVAFLGTWLHAGAFYDIVRPDGLLLGLLGWSVALIVTGARGGPVASGLLLAAAVLTKHNALAFAPALALCAGWRGGWRSALTFLACALVPVVALTALLQVRSGGMFLTYLLEVPASHGRAWARAWPDTPRELGTPLAVPLAVICGWQLIRAVREQRSFPAWAAAGLPVTAGTLSAWWGTYVPPADGSGVYNVPAAVAFFSLAAMPVAEGLLRVGQRDDRLAGRPVDRRPLLEAWALGVTGLVVCAAMRMHDGGFVNVHAPMFWLITVGAGLLLAEARATSTGRWVAAAAIVTHLFWVYGMIEPRRLLPDAADLAAGDRFVAACREVDGPVLSPFGAWIPVYAGRPPSLHYQAIWDLQGKRNPLRDAEDQAMRRAIREGRWALVIAGNQPIGYGLPDHYRSEPPLIKEADRALRPRTGWPARPTRLMFPGR
ncbi:MAG: hypothetical protein H6735_25465 [Alphaproteobacteria bacterium]|nr:hypothetical protein [Alphaproteobacteria bacterium]